MLYLPLHLSTFKIMADIEKTPPATDITAQHHITLQDISQRLLGRILRLLGYRRRQNEDPSVKRASSKSSIRRCNPQNGSTGINRRQDLRARRQKHMPFLSKEHRHLQHDKCFAPHLIDAVRLYKLLSRLEEEQKESENLVLDLRAKSLEASMHAEALRKFQIKEFEFIIEEHETNLGTSHEDIQKRKSPSCLIGGQGQCVLNHLIAKGQKAMMNVKRSWPKSAKKWRIPCRVYSRPSTNTY